MNLHKMIEICSKDDNMHTFIMINALNCINNYVITCMNSMLSRVEDILPRARQQIRFYKAVFIGPPSSRMPTVTIRSAYNARQH